MMGMPRVVACGLAWILAVLMGVLAIASFTGSGNGLFGTGIGRSPASSWIVLGIGGLAILFILLNVPHANGRPKEESHET